ncbi:MAG: DUF998 domain-containing protein [Candidatus Kariarchaeaceae archaeon]|jgi:hypothetical protein
MREIEVDQLGPKIRQGKIYGFGTVVALTIFLPLAMILSPEYKQTDQMSDLGVTKESALVFNVSTIFLGYCLFQYYRLYIRNTASPANFKYRSIVIAFGQIAGIGTIGVGIIPYRGSLKEIHTWLAVLFFAGMSISILLYSMYLLNTRTGRRLAYFGFAVFVYSLMYPMFFRMQPSKGYWQKIYLFSIVLWHLLLDPSTLDEKNAIN